MASERRLPLDTDVQIQYDAARTPVRLDTLLATISDVIVVVGKDGRCLEIIPTNAAATLGWSADVARERTAWLLGKTLYEVFPPDDAARLQNAITNALQTRKLQTVEHASDIWERRIWFSTAISPLSEDTVVWVSRDITALKDAFDRLASQEEQYRSIFEAASDGLVINDFETGRLLAANPAFCRMHGYDDMTGMHPTEFIHPNSHHLFEEYIRTTRTGGEFRCQAQDVRRDGTVFDVEVLGRSFTYQGKPATLGVVRDITEQVHNEQQYRSIFEATTDSLLIHAVSDLHVVEANAAACAMFGYSRDELLGKLPDQLMQADSWDSDFINAVIDGRPRRTRAVGMRSDGTKFEMESSGIPFLFKGEQHLLCVQRDVTEQVRSEQLLEERVEARTRELATLLEVSQAVASTLELKPLLDIVLDQTRRIVDYDRATFLLAEADGLVVAAVKASAAPLDGAVDASVGRRVSLEDAGLSAIWETLSRGEPVIITDITDAALPRALCEIIEDAVDDSAGPICSWMAVPMIFKESIVGLLTASRRNSACFNQHDADLASALGSQVAIAIENARLYEHAQQLAAVEERQRLARELHDSVSQALYGIALGARTARTLLDRDPAAAIEPTEYVLSLAEAGLAEMRALIFDLRPESLENEGLVNAINKQVVVLQTRYAIAIDPLETDEPEAPLPVKEAVYRIVREALHNVVKHARAKAARLKLTATASAILFELQDDGVGFDVHQSLHDRIGLKSMRERAEKLGGSLEIKSEPGKGTTVSGMIPLQYHVADDWYRPIFG